MELDAYNRAARQHADELATELRSVDIEELAQACRTIGEVRFRDYLLENASAMLDYIQATPSSRKKKHRNLDPLNRALFALGALYHCQLGVALLDAVCRSNLEAGPPYRTMTTQAAAAALGLIRDLPPLWPFEDHPDPFDEPS